MLTVYITYGAVMAVLTVAAIWCAVQNRRHPGPPSRLGQVLEADRLDRMAAGHREQPPQNLAWPPATTTRPRLFVSSGVHPCGCVVETTPEGARLTPCQIHDDDFVSEWEGRLQL